MHQEFQGQGWIEVLRYGEEDQPEYAVFFFPTIEAFQIRRNWYSHLLCHANNNPSPVHAIPQVSELARAVIEQIIDDVRTGVITEKDIARVCQEALGK